MCLADWVLVQDLGFFGGVGTDPNSMVPMVIVFVSGYLALVRVPALAAEATPVHRDGSVTAPFPARRWPAPRPWWDRVAPGYLTRVLAAIAAIAIVLVGAVPMAAASINPNADPILATAVDGTPNIVDFPRPPSTSSTRPDGPVSLVEPPGADGGTHLPRPGVHLGLPLDRAEFRDANRLLGADSSRVVFVAVVTNPIYRTSASPTRSTAKRACST